MLLSILGLLSRTTYCNFFIHFLSVVFLSVLPFCLNQHPPLQFKIS
nr:MAG TPA: hypothetical protein [Caudoviricetes sp.]